MAEANRKEEVNADIAAVWDLITSLENYSWRSGLDRIEILEPGRTFREYTRDGFATTFTITVCKPMNRYEFDMENENIQGHWIGILEQTQRGTMLDFTEKVTAKKVWMKPFAGMYLAPQQKVYMEDLKKALNAANAPAD